MPSLRKNRIRMVSILIVVLIIYLGYGFFFYSIRHKRAFIESLKTELVVETKKADEVITLRKTIQGTNDDRKKLTSYFVSSDNAVSFLETIENYGKLAGTTFSLETVDLETPAPSVKGDAKGKVLANNGIRLSFKAQGTFTNVYRLLLMIENAPYSITFEKAYFSQLPTAIDPTAVKNGLAKSPILPLWEGSFTIRLVSFIVQP